MKSQQLKKKEWLLFIAHPDVRDPLVAGGVILVFANDEDGVAAFLLNKSAGKPVSEMTLDFDCDMPMYWGGDSADDALFYIHKIDILEGGTKIEKDIYLLGSYKQLKVFIEIGKITSPQIRFYAGCCCWDPGEFEKEMYQGLWLEIPPDLITLEEAIFSDTPEILWEIIYKKYHAGGLEKKFLARNLFEN